MGRPRSAARRNWPGGLYQNTAGYFYWRDHDGQTYGLGYDKAFAFAEARAANAKRAAEESKTLVERISQSDCPLLKDWVETWIDHMSPGLAPKTIKTYRSTFREFVARCGHILVCDITPKMIADLLEEYATTDRARTAELFRTTVLELFRLAEQRGHITTGKNPVTPTKVKKAKVKRVRLSLETFLQIHAQQTRHWAKRAMELALVSAQRRGDVQAMKRPDLIDGHLLVDQRKSGGSTKLGIPTTLRLAAVGWTLGEIIEKCRTPGLISPFFVHHATKGGYHAAGDEVAVDTISEAFQKARDRVIIEIPEGRKPPTFHEIRSLAIRLYKAEYGDEFAQTLAGHKNMKTTLLYADPRDSEAKRIMIPDPGSKTVLNQF